MDSGRQVQFNLREHPHLDYGYAVTSHSSQGVTADRVLLHVDTERSHEKLINTRLAYVAISRARYDAQIYTNDAESLSRVLSKEVSKHSAITVETRSDLGRDQGHAAEQSPAGGVSGNKQLEQQQICEHAVGR